MFGCFYRWLICVAQSPVDVLIKPGRSPATYAPTPSEIKALARSDVFFGIGLPAEKRLRERMAEVLESVHFVDPATWRGETPATEAACAHGEHDAHAHGGHGSACGEGVEDPHVWLDPERMIAFTTVVVRELSAAAPEAADGFARRGAALTARLEALDATIRERLAPHKGRAFYINHASLGHFAARYGLEQRSIERSGGAPSSRRILEMIREAREHDARAVLAQVQFNRSTADVLARALEVPILEVDPLARDYVVNLKAVTELLLQAFGENKGGAK